MDYAEFPLPPELEGWAKTSWTMTVGARASERIEHRATPDGCIEVIRRLHGRSFWHREQPPAFVAGLVDRPADLVFSGDAAFVGLRLWPWAWHALGGRACAGFRNDWIALDQARLPEDAHRALERLNAGEASPIAALLAPASARRLAMIGAAILDSDSVADLAARSGWPMRRLQRWFARHVGLAPRTYLRLLRFQDTLTALQGESDTLADQAAARGYADQAHMSREFRALSGLAAGSARRRARGPFV